MSPQSDHRLSSATAFAPATVANVSVGFDVLGFAVAGAGDRVTVTRDPDVDGVRVDSIGGVVRDLPIDPAKNTASVAASSLLGQTGDAGGFRLALDKGIPLGSGMGGSAASAVAAVVALNHLVERPLGREDLLAHAAAGEQVASGAAHADNAAACLFGGMCAVVATEPLRVVSIPVPERVRCVLVHPHMRLDTREARAALPETVSLERHVDQAKRLAGFLSGCFHDDLELVRRSMQDLIAEPARARLIPGFERVRSAALDHGAIGFGIAGAGPSVFAWVASDAAARDVEERVRAEFDAAGLGTDAWIGPIANTGAVVESKR